MLVHGNWGSRAWWAPVLERTPPGVRAIAYDLRGRGETRGPSGDGSFGSHAADLAAFAVALGLERFALAAHSLGTAVALQYALERPGALRALVAVSPTWVDGMPPSFAVAEHQERLAVDRAYLEAALRAITPAAPRDAVWE
ncbi:MAG: alpha/beta hydrolase, partial [Chloroflexota bacterium]|nr:alpha/beta hydrolase [Chloroflexota bacterium]